MFNHPWGFNQCRYTCNNTGSGPSNALSLQEPELSLKRIAASALSDISKHTPELAQAVVDAGAVQYLAPLVINQDAKLKRQVWGSLADRTSPSP